MGIVERELTDFDLSDGTTYRIEYNQSGRIHLHIDTVRIDMSVDELEHFTEVVSEAKRNLKDVKQLDELP